MQETWLPEEIIIPAPKLPREAQQEPYLREIEIDPKEYTPENVQRDLVLKWGEMKISVEEMKKSRLR